MSSLPPLLGASFVGKTGPVGTLVPSGSTMAPAPGTPLRMAMGSGSSLPLASRKVPGAIKRVPVRSRTVVQGANLASRGGTTQRPGFHDHRRVCHLHSPSIQTASSRGCVGTDSARAGGGGNGTSERSDVECPTYVGVGILGWPHASAVMITKNEAPETMTLERIRTIPNSTSHTMVARERNETPTVRPWRRITVTSCHILRQERTYVVLFSLGDSWPAPGFTRLGKKAQKEHGVTRERAGAGLANARADLFLMTLWSQSYVPFVSRTLRLAAAFYLLATLAACRAVPSGRSAVDRITVRGADQIDAADIEEKIATTSSPKFLGLFQGVLYDYSIFDRNVFQRDLARVEAVYRSKGYYEAHARAGRVHWITNEHVRIEIVVDEGKPVLVDTVRVVGLEGLPKNIADLAERAAARALPRNEPFDEEQFDKALAAVRRVLTDRGYAYAKVKNDAHVDIVAHKADVVLTAAPGETCVFGSVSIEGLRELPDLPIRRAIDIDPGEPFSEAALESAQQAVLDLGVFASVEIAPDLSDPSRPDRVVPINVKVEPSRLRTVRLGGGIEFDALKADVHGIVGWENRNFLGGMRSFGVTFKPGVVLYPTRVSDIELPNRFLPESRLRFDFRQPGFIEARTNAFIRPELDVQALLVNPDPPPNQRVIGYGEIRNGIGIDRAYWKFYVAVSHNLQVAYPFAYVGSRDPTLGTLVISYPELITQLDFRDDRIHPRKGVWIGNTLQFAGGPFGGQAQDIKLQPDVRGYVPISRGVVLAVRGAVGFLFPRNYGSNIQHPGSLFEASEERTRDYQLTFFRGFFSGGPTTNRGYPLRGIGPHDMVPFISPELEVQRQSTTCGSDPGEFDCRTPTGGFTLWEASTEVRFKVTGPLSVATFCDASDVSPRTTDIRLSHLHLSCGAGGRYDTPVGPIRLDIGYRIPGLQVIGGLTPDEREPSTIPAKRSSGDFGIPIAISLGIGEAY